MDQIANDERKEISDIQVRNVEYPKQQNKDTFGPGFAGNKQISRSFAHHIYGR